MCRQGSGVHQAYSIDVVMIVLHAVILGLRPSLHVFCRSTSGGEAQQTLTHEGAAWGVERKRQTFKKNNLNLHVSVVCEVVTSQCAGKRNC